MFAISVVDSAAYAARWVATMFCFAVFGLGGLVFGVLAVPVVSVSTACPTTRVRRLRELLRRAFAGFLRLMSVTGATAFDLPQPDPAHGGRLVVANHPTLFDAVVLLALFPQADCIIKSGLLRNPFTRFALSGLDYISNDDTAAMLDTAVARLQSGRTLVVFPEGTRTPPGEMPGFHLAAAAIAVRAGVPCVPVVIECDPPATTKEEPWYYIAPRRPHYRLRIEPPLDVARMTDGLAPRYAKRALNAHLEAYYNRALSSSGPAAPPAPPVPARTPVHPFPDSG